MTRLPDMALSQEQYDAITKAINDAVREEAIDAAKEALGIETTYVNYYSCDMCGIDWESTWSCGVDDECPGCGRDFSPYDSVEIDDPENT